MRVWFSECIGSWCLTRRAVASAPALHFNIFFLGTTTKGLHTQHRMNRTTIFTLPQLVLHKRIAIAPQSHADTWNLTRKAFGDLSSS